MERKDQVETISVTLSVQIACPAADAYRFVADPATMPQWAIHNVKGIRPLGNNEWEIETPCGAGKLAPHFEQEFGSSTTNSLIRRKELKGWRRSKKIALVESANPTWADLSREWYDCEPVDYRRALDRMDT